MSQQMLLIDCCLGSGFTLELQEGVSKNGLVKFRGKFQEAEAVNKNKRMYPFDVLDENVQKLQDALRNNRLTGELDHPTDSIVHLSNASHKVTKLWWEGNILMGEGEILRTPSGQILKALIDDGVSVGISSRGVGNGKVNEEGILVIGESYKLITFDAVADPSTFAAFQERYVGKDESFLHHVTNILEKPMTRTNSAKKIEQSGIHNISIKEALIAYTGGFIQSHTQKYKSRLG